MSDFEEADEFCPYCDNHYYIEAKVQQGELRVEVEAKEGYEQQLIKDDREKDRKATFLEED